MLFSCRRRSILLVLILLIAIACAHGQESTMQLTIDVRRPQSQKFPVDEEISVRPGKLTLSYPRWIPGTHGSQGFLRNIAGLKLRVGDTLLAWQRDLYDPFLIHCQIPDGSNRLRIHFDYLANKNDSDEVAFGIAASESVAIVNAASLFFAKKDQDIHKTQVTAKLLLPDGWQYATALPIGSSKGAAGEVSFAPVSLETLVDSPIMSGKMMQTVRLDANDGKDVPHYLCLFVDDPAYFPSVLTPAFQQSMKQLVTESGALFGVRHYPEFRFLLVVSTKIPVWGLEHHACSMNSLRPDAFGPKGMVENRDWWSPNLLPHEFLHSWNGKHRRPQGLVQTTFNTPQATDLLWVYEGLTEYLGEVMMLRAGFRDLEKWKNDILNNAVQQGNEPAREWQSLRDSAHIYPLLTQGGNGTALRTSNTVYFESFFLWLEIDTLLRKQTNGQKSLDEFCRLFFGGVNRGADVRPYTFRDVVDALDQVYPYDWTTFLNTRLDASGNTILSAGLENAGWNVSLSDAVPADRIALAESDYRFSLGLQIAPNGAIWFIKPDSLADKAGLTTEMRIAGVNGKQFSPAVFRNAVRATGGEKPVPLDLLIFEGNTYRTQRLEYTGGEKFPVLNRQNALPDLLAAIATPRVPAPPAAPSPTKP